MAGSAEDLGAPESWEVADVEESVKKLMLREVASSGPDEASVSASVSSSSSSSASSIGFGGGGGEKGGGVCVSEEVVNQVDQFLREALQNPRERLSILRMEQDVEKFIHDPTQDQLEFQQLPTSYLRLAAHRVAQHYGLQSMVLLDNNFPDGSGSRIIVRKTSDVALPVIRLADIPGNMPLEEGGAVKFAIKQRPQKRSQSLNSSSSHSSKSNSSKSVEERKEEYNRARARIFNATNSSVSAAASSVSATGSSLSASGKSEIEPNVQERILHSSLGISKMEERSVSGGFDVNVGRGLLDSTVSGSRPAKNRTEKEPVRYRPNSRVAIFRDRDVDRKDPDYDRSYDRYMQRFDPGFGFNGGSYAMQPMYSPAINYNTEFPQLGAPHRPQISSEHHNARSLPQHIPAPWAAPSTAAGIGYGHPEAMMPPFNPNHAGARSTSSIYLHSPQYPCQQPGMPFMNSHEHIHPSYSQSHQQQPETSFGLARPR